MAYYAVAHLLQGGDMYCDTTPAPTGIPADALTPEVWDYVFQLSDQLPEGSRVGEEALRTMRREFEFWYPFDLRVSGKDLIQVRGGRGIGGGGGVQFLFLLYISI